MVGGALIGREKQLRELSRALETALAGRGALTLIAGEGGVGKTRLAEELAVIAEEKGAIVCWGRAWEGGGAPPFWPWTEALRAIVDHLPANELRAQLGSAAGELAQLLPELAVRFDLDTPAPATNDPRDRFRLFDAVSTMLAKLRVPLVLVLEDLHAADPPTLLLLAFVAQRINKCRIAIIATYRELEARLMPELAETLAKIARFGKTISLQRLDRSAVAEMIFAHAGTAVDANVIDKLYRTTEGSPLFLIEVLRFLDLDRLAAGEDAPIPDSVRGAIREHLSRLDREARSTLTFAAAIGRETAMAIIVEASERPAEPVHRDLASAVRLGILSELRPGRYAFAHALIRDVLYQDTDPAERARLHRTIAEAIERVHHGDPDAPLAEIAHHLSLAGPSSLSRAFEYLRSASRRSNAMYAYEEAVLLLERAQQILEQVAPGDARRRAELLLELGAARICAGQGERGEEDCVAAARLARELGSPELLARAALEVGHRFVLAVVDRTCVELLEEALAALPDVDTPLRARVLARLSAALVPSKTPEIPLDMARTAMAMARRCGDRAALIEVLQSAGSGMLDFAPARERLPNNLELAALANAAGEKSIAARAHLLCAFDCIDLADLDGADKHIRAQNAIAHESRLPHLLWPAHMLRAMRARLAGRIEEADRELDAAAAVIAGTDDPMGPIVLLLHPFHAARVADAHEQLLRAAPRLDHLDWSSVGSIVVLYRSAMHAQRGEVEDAKRAAAHLPVEIPVFAHLNSVLTVYAEICFLLGDRVRAEYAYRVFLRCEGQLTTWTAYGFACEGPADRGLMLLALALDRFEDAERHFLAAQAIASRIGALPWLARTELDYARALRSRDPARAKALAVSAAAHARSVGLLELAAHAEELGGGSLASFAGGRYVVLRELGRGGQKTVYLVHDTALDRDAALAFIDPALLDATAVERMRSEAQALARMGSHPHVVAVFDLGEDHGRPFIVSEHLAGGDLALELSRTNGALSISRARALGEDVLRGLIAVHERGLIHRDLKPSNVLLDAAGRAKIGDFGLALIEGRARVSEQDAFEATAAYCSPEQIENAPLFDARSDLYSFGCLFYELLTGRPPFSGPLAALLAQHLHAAPVAPSAINPDVSETLDRFVLRLLAKSPADRPASAHDALVELSQ